MKMSPPRYQDIRGGDVALLSSPDGGALVRVIAGELDGHQGPGITHTPITVLHATVAAGARARLPWNPDYNALVYVLNGRGTVGPDRRPIRMGQLAVLGAGDVIEVGADESAGEPQPEPGPLRPRRPTDPRARRGLRPVRHEHPRGAGAGVRGLPGRSPRHDPDGAAPRPRRPLIAFGTIADKPPCGRPSGRPRGGLSAMVARIRRVWRRGSGRRTRCETPGRAGGRGRSPRRCRRR